MSRGYRSFDQRQFGRRQTLWHAWFKVAGREREPCVVRNFSVAGALLEFDGDPPVANRFRLMIDVYRFEAECFVRHRSRNAVGVNFDEFAMPELTADGCSAAELFAHLQREAAMRQD